MKRMRRLVVIYLLFVQFVNAICVTVHDIWKVIEKQ